MIVLSNASAAWGGVHQVTEVLARGLQARGYPVVVFGRPGSMLEGLMDGVAPFEPVLKGMDLHPATLWRVRRALRRHAPRAVFCLMKKDVRTTGATAWALGIPAVVCHANDRPLRNAAYHRLVYGVMPAAHVANSHATRRTLLASAPWLRPEAVRVIHNGIDAAPFRAARPATLGLPAGAFAVGFVGRFDARKGLLDLARAWSRVASALPAAWLVMVGQGREEAQARALLADAPRVAWLGYRRDVPAVLRALDVLAVPSHWEGFGLIAAEGLAAGVPVVAADASSLPEIVRDEVDGLLVPPRDPEALAAALLRLGSDPALRARLAAAGAAAAAERFGVERMLDGYERVLRDVALNPSSPPPARTAGRAGGQR